LTPRRRRFNLPPMSLDRASVQPMYLQFRAALARAIRTGQLPAGSRLPSTRAAARLFGVSRNTVVTAYEILAADELIESAAGFGHASPAGAHDRTAERPRRQSSLSERL